MVFFFASASIELRNVKNKPNFYYFCKNAKAQTLRCCLCASLISLSASGRPSSLQLGSWGWSVEVRECFLTVPAMWEWEGEMRWEAADGEKGEKVGWICSFRCNLKCGRRCYERCGIVHESRESPVSSGLHSKVAKPSAFPQRAECAASAERMFLQAIMGAEVC